MISSSKCLLAKALLIGMVVLTAGFTVSGICQGGPTSSVASVALAVASWTPTGNLNYLRAGHTATLLRNGKVLVAGGDTTVAETYDPDSGTWSFTSPMIMSRSGFAATLLTDGRVLMVGGNSRQAGRVTGTGTAEIYDPISSTWSLTGSLNTPRAGFTATLLQSGKVLVAGGVDNDGNSLGSAELYDPITGVWSNTGSLHSFRFWHTATLLSDGKVLVAAGSIDDFFGTVIAVAELYDPAAGTWSLTSSLHTARQLHTATLLPNGKVLVAGGYASLPPPGGSGIYTPTSYDSAEIYDPATGQWSDTGKLGTARNSHSAVALFNGKVLVAGGYNYPSQVDLYDAELYDVNSGTWLPTASLNVARTNHTATVLADGRVLVAGGATFATLSAELYQQEVDNSFRVTHLFSNRSGSAQFLQLSELSGLDNQNSLTGRTLTVTSSNGLPKRFTFPNDLPSTATKYKSIALGTSNSDFVDYIIPHGFLPTDGGIINFSGVDTWTFGPLPVDGHTILARAQPATFLRDFLDRNYQPIWVIDTVVEYYNKTLDHYFITASQPDIDVLDSGRIAGWARTGVTFPDWITRDVVEDVLGDLYPPPPNLLDVCRFYIPPAQGDSHFFSASTSECASIPTLFPTFIQESPSAFFATLPNPTTGACSNNQLPVYRVWNKRWDSNHRYLTSIAARDDMVKRGYVAEGWGPDVVTLCVGGFG